MSETKFLATPPSDPAWCEYVEEYRGKQLHGRILCDGLEVATLRYTEDYHWGQLYAKTPELVALIRQLLESHPPTITGRCPYCFHHGDDCIASKAQYLLDCLDIPC